MKRCGSESDVASKERREECEEEEEEDDDDDDECVCDWCVCVDDEEEGDVPVAASRSE